VQPRHRSCRASAPAHGCGGTSPHPSCHSSEASVEGRIQNISIQYTVFLDILSQIPQTKF
jgi:hypothetical protein